MTCTLVLLHPRNIQCSRVPTRAAVQGRERRGTGPHQCPHSGVPCVGACSSTCAATRCARPRAPATRSRTCRSMRHREVACRHSRARHWPPAPHPVIAACDGRPSLRRMLLPRADAAHALPAGHCLLSSDAHMYADGRGGHSLTRRRFLSRSATVEFSFAQHDDPAGHVACCGPLATCVCVCVWGGGGATR